MMEDAPTPMKEATSWERMSLEFKELVGEAERLVMKLREIRDALVGIRPEQEQSPATGEVGTTPDSLQEQMALSRAQLKDLFTTIDTLITQIGG